MQLYPADDAALGLCLRAAFDGGKYLHPVAVNSLGKRLWQIEQTKPALLRIMHESPNSYVRVLAFYWLMLRYGAAPDLRTSIFLAAAAESKPEAHRAMMLLMGG